MLIKKELKKLILAVATTFPVMASGIGFENIFIVGDSLSDQGNLLNATESLINDGQAIPVAGFDPIAVPPPPNYWEGRFADGEVWPGIMAEWLDIDTTAASLCSYGNEAHTEISCSGGTNFADGGSRVDYNRIEVDASKPFPVNLLGHDGTAHYPSDAYPWSLNTQVEAFSQYLGAKGPDSLYVVFTGANDLSDLINMVAICAAAPGPENPFCSGRGTPAEGFPVMIGGISNAIQRFATAGGRDILVPNMPNLGIIPAVTGAGPQAAGLATQLSTLYNEALADMLAQWEGVVNIIPFDTYDLITKVVANPQDFGFDNATSPCYEGFVDLWPGGICADPDSHVFWDIEHPTSAFHGFLADRMLSAIVLDFIDDMRKRVDALAINAFIKTRLLLRLNRATSLLEDEDMSNDYWANWQLIRFGNMIRWRLGWSIPYDEGVSLIDRASQTRQLVSAGY